MDVGAGAGVHVHEGVVCVHACIPNNNLHTLNLCFFSWHQI